MSSTYHRFLSLPAIVVVACACALATARVPARATTARTLVIRGAGFGHGVGMSQEGALGYAQHGYEYSSILAHYYTGTALSQAPAGERVRVLLQGNAGRVLLSGADHANGHPLNPSASYAVTLHGRHGVLLRGGRTHVSGATLRVTGPALLKLRGVAENGVRDGLYRGALELAPALGRGVNAIDDVSLEDYTRGVISGEAGASWPAAVLNAQAVASRTYGITAHSGPSNAFDVYSDTRSQVYRGVVAETPSTDRAVAATSGQLVSYGGRPVITYFFSTSGGRTENVENAFPGAAPEPWLRGVPDPFDEGSLHSWSKSLGFSAAASRLRGLTRGAFRGIEVLERGYSPRILSAYVLGSGGRTKVSGGTLAARLSLYDTWAYFSINDSHGTRPEPDHSGQSEPANPEPSSPAPTAPDPSGGVLPGTSPTQTPVDGQGGTAAPTL
ncbi:MAG TPA: SpoIID/LytB domain-containing protein [Solirubrobacteraceae bacterium]|nr:SpoIID/LytB domain-containing protein [Solirubrobacteraceae bacterium]